MNIFLKRSEKRGQESIGMSFNMIFSIFIIIIIIAVAVYVIAGFLDNDGPVQCANTGLFYDKLQREVNKIFSGDDLRMLYKDEIKSSGALRSGLSYVCFGNLSSNVVGSINVGIHRNLTRLFRDKDYNIFMYPPEKACKGLEGKKIDNVIIEDFFCVNIKDNEGIIRIKLESRNGSPVKITNG